MLNLWDYFSQFYGYKQNQFINSVNSTSAKEFAKPNTF